MTEEITLYGLPISLYTGRVRSYLIKAGIPYRETPHSSLRFMETVLPKAGGRRGVPTIEFPDGTVIRDSVAIVDHFEAERGHPHSPATPRQRIVSRLFDVIGAEGLLRPAMHYRWNFPEHEAFVMFHFHHFQPINARPEQTAAARAEYLRTVTVPLLGVVPETIELVETLYLGLLQKLDAHFSDQPYLLGGKPCIGDFGMIGPFYGHLGRDPKPLSLMQTHAFRVLRWVERMNRPELDVGEFKVQDGQFLVNDAIPDTLIEVLKHLAIDFVPETRAAAIRTNEWIDEQDSLAPGTECERDVGQGICEVNGVTVSVAAQPFRFYLLKRVQNEFETLDAQDQKEVADLLAACDMTEILDLKLSRDIGWKNNLEVWL